LRKALEDGPENPRYIKTIAGGGYRFIADVIESSPTAEGEGASPRVKPEFAEQNKTTVTADFRRLVEPTGIGRKWSAIAVTAGTILTIMLVIVLIRKLPSKPSPDYKACLV
jgi:hypothetical protein